jgi:hypothetical protein
LLPQTPHSLLAAIERVDHPAHSGVDLIRRRLREVRPQDRLDRPQLHGEAALERWQFFEDSRASAGTRRLGCVRGAIRGPLDARSRASTPGWVPQVAPSLSHPRQLQREAAHTVGRRRVRGSHLGARARSLVLVASRPGFHLAPPSEDQPASSRAAANGRGTPRRVRAHEDHVHSHGFNGVELQLEGRVRGTNGLYRWWRGGGARRHCSGRARGVPELLDATAPRGLTGLRRWSTGRRWERQSRCRHL